MLDRLKIETVLTRRFPGATHEQIAAAANAIMGLDDEWEELVDRAREAPKEMAADSELRVFRRREL